MNDRELRYNRDFLKWDNNKITKTSNLYYPKFHIHPTKGLINDPNCVFYYKSKYYVFFQHHPNNPLHGLKTMSLAITKDFKNYEYKYMLNKPIDDFSYHGIYSGNAIVHNKKVICMYTGNARDKNWIRTSSIVISEYNLETENFVNKKVLVTNFDFKKYTEHFRDPFIFKNNNKLYFAIGAQNIQEQGVILIFKLSNNLEKAELIHEISISYKYRMIECPCVIFSKGKVALIYSPQYKQNLISKNQNPDIVRYMILEKNEFLCNDFKLDFSSKQENIIDYGFEYYAPQAFMKNKKNAIIAWSGIPTSNNYPEAKNNWIFCLSSIKYFKIKNNLIHSKLPLKAKKNFYTKHHEIKTAKINLKLYEKLILGDESSNIKIDFTDRCFITITRYDEKKYYPYKNKVKINLDKPLQKIKVELFYDTSIIELSVNKTKWFTSRLYPSKFNIVKE